MKKVYAWLIYFASSFLKMGQYSTCRFHPTCSAYAVEALEKRSFMDALAMIAKRLFRCHPWSSGGSDPVEPKFQEL